MPTKQTAHVMYSPPPVAYRIDFIENPSRVPRGRKWLPIIVDVIVKLHNAKVNTTVAVKSVYFDGSGSVYASFVSNLHRVADGVGIEGYKPIATHIDRERKCVEITKTADFNKEKVREFVAKKGLVSYKADKIAA